MIVVVIANMFKIEQEKTLHKKPKITDHRDFFFRIKREEKLKRNQNKKVEVIQVSMSVIFSNAGCICPVREKNFLNRKICRNSNPSQNSSTEIHL